MNKTVTADGRQEPARGVGPASGRRGAVDWPTVGVVGFVYSAFALLTWHYHLLPWWFVLVAGGYIVCLHGSLQHEAVHGQPTRHRWLNTLFVAPSLWLWLPYTYYRETHTNHHRDERLTCPVDDPESNYMLPETWQSIGPFHQRVRGAMTTLLGRMLLGPPYVVWRTALRLSVAIRRGDRRHLQHWLRHLPGVALVIWWVMAVCRIPLTEYVLLFAYPGLSLTLMRSYAEHRAARAISARTAIVETGPFMGFVFLHNNLHALHHAETGTVWHQRPARYRSRRQELLAANGDYLFKGYGQLIARYLLRGKEPPVHPLAPV